MDGLTNYSEDLLLKWLFTTSAASRPTAWYAATHIADPGETGASAEVTTGTDADYTRKSITFDDPVSNSGQALSNAAVSWTVDAASAGYTVTHISIWTAASGGSCLIKGALPVPRSLSANQVLTFSIGDIIAALT